ncbi:hypothetical protein niasHS_005687 [Heterodera schachtii]|uniref:EF-hand domain-containing protein n=1 Tax=Heterodera schachtii TaxID=97005 RepID=A0ABD2JZB3_HETSC
MSSHLPVVLRKSLPISVEGKSLSPTNDHRPMAEERQLTKGPIKDSEMIKKSAVILSLLLCAVLVAQFVEQANAYCCKVSDWPIGHPPNCNIFGCNCDCLHCVNVIEKGCCIAQKTGLTIGCSETRLKRHALPQQPKRAEAKEVFQQADTDGDGALSMDEAVNFLVSKWNMTEGELTNPDKRHWFTEIDVNRNEKLEPEEIDEAMTK